LPKFPVLPGFSPNQNFGGAVALPATPSSTPVITSNHASWKGQFLWRIKSGFLNLWASEEFLTGHALIAVEYVVQDDSRQQRFLLPWKRNLAAGLMWKRTVHYHVLSLEYLCILTTNRLSLRLL